MLLKVWQTMMIHIVWLWILFSGRWSCPIICFSRDDKKRNLQLEMSKIAKSLELIFYIIEWNKPESNQCMCVEANALCWQIHFRFWKHVISAHKIVTARSFAFIKELPMSVKSYKSFSKKKKKWLLAFPFLHSLTPIDLYLFLFFPGKVVPFPNKRNTPFLFSKKSDRFMRDSKAFW